VDLRASTISEHGLTEALLHLFVLAVICVLGLAALLSTISDLLIIYKGSSRM
jgi:hypothetical protein